MYCPDFVFPPLSVAQPQASARTPSVYPLAHRLIPHNIQCFQPAKSIPHSVWTGRHILYTKSVFSVHLTSPGHQRYFKPIGQPPPHITSLLPQPSLPISEVHMLMSHHININILKYQVIACLQKLPIQ